MIVHVLPPHPQVKSCRSVCVSIHHPITSYFSISSLFGCHQTSLRRPLLPIPRWPLGLLVSPWRPLPTSQPSAICLFPPSRRAAHLAARQDRVDSPSLVSSSYQTHVEGLISRWASGSAWQLLKQPDIRQSWG